MKLIIGSLLTVFIWIAALIPLWIFLGARSLTNPVGFWQNIVLFGLGFWVLGWIQVMFFIVGLAITITVWQTYYE